MQAGEPDRWDRQDAVVRLMREQLRIMAMQLDTMRAADSAAAGAWRTPVPVLPNVARFLERDSPHSSHWNLGVLLVPRQHLDPATTRLVVAALVRRHDALRLRFSRDGAGWTSALASADEPPPFAVCDLAGLPPAEVTAAIERRCAEAQGGLDLERGPMVHVELFELGEQGQRLLVVAHHFVMDQLAWPPFWEDFEALYRGLEQGGREARPAVETTFSRWAWALQRYADSEGLAADRRRWLDLPWERVRPIPLDHPAGRNTNASAGQVQVVLTPRDTARLLNDTRGVARKASLMVAALARTVAAWTGSDTVLIDMMCHGRNDEVAEGVDPLQTVGFLTSYTPLVLSVADAGPDGACPSLLAQVDALISRGLDFDLLRSMSSDVAVREAFGGLPRAPILYNHHGQRDEPDELPHSAMFGAAPESIGPTHAPDGLRAYPLAISSETCHGCLSLSFVYSAALHERSTITWLADEFARRLTSVVAEAVR